MQSGGGAIRLLRLMTALALLAGGACDDDERAAAVTDAGVGHDAPADMSPDVGVERPPETGQETATEVSAEAPREAGGLTDAEVGETPAAAEVADAPGPALAGTLGHERRGPADGGADEEVVSIDLGVWVISIRGTGAADQMFPLAHADREAVTTFLREPGVWEALTGTEPCQTADAGESPLVAFQAPGQFRHAKSIGSCPGRPYTRFLSLWIELRKRYFGAEVCSATFVPPPSWQPPFRCSRGGANSACDDVAFTPTCENGRWVCPRYQVPSHLCVCFLPFGCRDAGAH
jgi:hypothetical protein